MIGLLGISYKSAKIEVREQFSFLPKEIEEFNGILSQHKNYRASVIVSTCNRTELYLHYNKIESHKVFELVTEALAKMKGYSDSLKKFFYFKTDRDVVKHLFEVSSGIDSLVIGEDQIIGQVRNSFRLAEETKSADTILSRLFTKAFEAGKKVRSTTCINQGSASVSSAAVDLSVSFFPKFSNQNILIIGAGQTGQLVLTSLAKKNFKSLYIANRTFEKAEKLALKYNASAYGLNSISEVLPKSDIIIVATDSQDYLIDKQIIKTSTKENRIKKQLFIDLSVPRNIDPEIENLPNTKLFAVDDLTKIVESTTQKRSEAINDADVIIDQLVVEYWDWLTIRGLSPIFSKIKTNFHKVNESELNGFAKIKGIKDESTLEEYGKHISDKYARLFIRNLRNLATNGKNKESIEAINELFDIR